MLEQWIFRVIKSVWQLSIIPQRSKLHKQSDPQKGAATDKNKFVGVRSFLWWHIIFLIILQKNERLML